MQSSPTTSTDGPGEPVESDVLDGIERELAVLARHLRSRRSIVVGAGQDDRVDRLDHVVLRRLEAAGPLRTGELAADVELDASTMSRRAAALVDVGLVDRHPDPDDGRACRLRVSERGTAFLEESRHRRRDLLADLLLGWSARDRRELLRLLARFNSGVLDDAGEPDRPTTRRTDHETRGSQS